MQLPQNTPTNPTLLDLQSSIKTEAEKSQGNISEILTLLRMLEELHRGIRDDLFLQALPTNRQALYALLREIEQNGGWPYIPRFKIRDFLEKVEEAENNS